MDESLNKTKLNQSIPTSNELQNTNSQNTFKYRLFKGAVEFEEYLN